jgi:hypothetical protein
MKRKAKKATSETDAFDRIAWALDKPGTKFRYWTCVVSVVDGVAYATNGHVMAWAKCNMPEGAYEKQGKGKSATWNDAPDARPIPSASLLEEHARASAGAVETIDAEELLAASLRAKVAHSEGTPKEGSYSFRRSGSKATPIRIVADGSGAATLSTESDDCEFSQTIRASGSYAIAVNCIWLASALKMLGASVALRPVQDGLSLSGADSGCLIMGMRDDAVMAINRERQTVAA